MEFSRFGSIFDQKVGTESNGCYSRGSFADVAQLVEHHLAKVRVASSNLVVRSQQRGLDPLGPGHVRFFREPTSPVRPSTAAFALVAPNTVLVFQKIRRIHT